MRLFVFKQNVRNFLHLPTTQVKTRQKYHLRLVRKNPIDYFELYNRIIPDCRVRKHQFPKLHKFGDIEECIIWNPTPQNTVFSEL